MHVSQQGGGEPVWGPDGHELLYRGSSADGHPALFVASLGEGSTFTVTGRREMFSLVDYVGVQPHANCDVSRDGRYFVMVRRSPSTRILIIQRICRRSSSVFEAATEPDE